MSLYQFIIYLLEHKYDTTVLGIFILFVILLLVIKALGEMTIKAIGHRR